LTPPDNPRVVTATEIELLREAYQDFNNGVMREDLLTEDFVLEQSRAIVDTRHTFRGPGALAEAYEELQTGFDTVRMHPVDFEVRDDWIIVSVVFETSTRGMEQRAKITHLWQVRDGRFAHMRVVGIPGEGELGD
jgi:ketosteroid isomerase-like protein